MKQFFKFMFASTLGTVLAGIVLFFVFTAIIVGSLMSNINELSGDKKITSVSENTVLELKLNRPVVDRDNENDISFDFGPFNSSGSIGLNAILANIEKAKKDDRIKGIYITAAYPMAGAASLTEIRNALEDFKTSGKWIVSYSEVLSQGGYYLASVADEIYIMPSGGMEFRGLSSSIMFYKQVMEKLGVEMQVIRGKNNKFKSAVEPFLYTEMSEANKEQSQKYMDAIWNSILNRVEKSRGISKERLNEIADNLEATSSDDAVRLNLIDKTLYRDEVLKLIAEKVGEENTDDIKFLNIAKYTKAQLPGYTPNFGADRIAVIYAEGEIVDGKGGEGSIGSVEFAEALRKAGNDDKVKAIVLRVNSPGGSALASEVIWREASIAKSKKPLIVSMGNVAASGGYYISAPADKIFAQENTITGSIGVFGLIPNAKELIQNKIGFKFDGVSTNKNSQLGFIYEPLSAFAANKIQEGVEEIYDTFVTRVANGRKLDKDFVDGIGQGRVWSGIDALEIGLVDELGGLNAAIAEAATRAELTDYRLVNYPEAKDPFTMLLEEITGESVVTGYIDSKLKNNPEVKMYVDMLENIPTMNPIQARLPYNIVIK